jgi:methionyl-tRNA synthetase
VIKFKKFYVTTPIYYVNDVPHIGSAFTTIAADILARFHRIKGEDVFFLTGTDEHGKKIQEIAESKGKKPKDFVDRIVKSFKEMWTRLNISNDNFIRTTDPNHIKDVKRILRELYDKKLIYKGSYKSYYCTGCEQYLTQKDLVDGCCPLHKKEPEIREEESYLFKLSAFQNKILELIETDNVRILPETRKNEMVNIIKEGLNDISISRKKSEVYWGIELPFDTDYTCYVWVDAFWNYVTGLGNDFKKFWPPDVQLMAKDISRVHSTIWLGLLLALGYELPKTIFVHGYFTVDGKKMSKSLGNIVDPKKIVEKYGLDTLRYYLFRDTPFGEDGDFSESVLINRYNSELADSLGNLVNRVLVLVEKNFDGKVPERHGDEILNTVALGTVKNYERDMEDYQFHHALQHVFFLVNESNKYINENKLWEIKDKKKLGGFLYELLESLRFTAILLYPFMPETSEKIFDQLGLKKKFQFKDLEWGSLSPLKKTNRGEILFKKIK